VRQDQTAMAVHVQLVGREFCQAKAADAFLGDGTEEGAYGWI